MLQGEDWISSSSLPAVYVCYVYVDVKKRTINQTKKTNKQKEIHMANSRHDLEAKVVQNNKNIYNVDTNF